MAEGLRRNPPEQGTTPETSNPDKMNSIQSPNQGGNLNEGEITHGQPPQFEDDAGAVDYESELTAAELMEREWLLLCLGLNELKKQLGDSLKEIQGTEGTEGTAELETMIQKAFKYMQQFGRDDDRSKLLAGRVVQIADSLEAAVITRSTEFLYETKAGLLKRLISLMVVLILSVGPNDSEFRGRKTEISSIDHPNNAFLRVLEEAANELLNEAEKLNDPRELIDATFVLFVMTKVLRPDELRPIYNKIVEKISIIMKNGDIDNNLREQFNGIINQDINDKSIEQLHRIFHQLVDQYR